MIRDWNIACFSFYGIWAGQARNIDRKCFCSRKVAVPRMTYRKLVQSTNSRPCASLLHRRLCETPRQGLRSHSLCVPHEEMQKLSLNCLSAEPFWNTHQEQIFFFYVTVTEHRGGLNKCRIITAIQSEL